MVASIFTDRSILLIPGTYTVQRLLARYRRIVLRAVVCDSKVCRQAQMCCEGSVLLCAVCPCTSTVYMAPQLNSALCNGRKRREDGLNQPAIVVARATRRCEPHQPRDGPAYGVKICARGIAGRESIHVVQRVETWSSSLSVMPRDQKTMRSYPPLSVLLHLRGGMYQPTQKG
jgi:hypothetical protein